MNTAFNFKLSSLNVRGLADVVKHRSIFHWLRKFHRGICFLQETHSVVQKEIFWKNEWGAPVYHSHGTHNSRGVAILMPNNLDYKVQDVISDDRGRLLILDILIDDTRFILANIYAPTKNFEKDQCEFLENVHEKIQVYLGLNIFLGGEF